MKIIEIKNLSYKYEDGTSAIEDFDLVINSGQQVAILGPNGAGKSTLLKLLAGLLFPYSGVIRLFGRELTKKNADRLRTGVGVLFQDPNDQIFMPFVRDDVAFGPINLGLDESEVEARVIDALRQTDLTGYEERTAHHLSYGEKKRVAIAGILAMKPELLLLDEPTANLDPRGKSEIIDVINQLKTTVIIATHDLGTAIRMANHAVVMNRTKLDAGPLWQVFSDEQLLRNAHLDVPDIARLFLELGKAGCRYDKLPLTVDEGMACIRKNAMIK
jgi:cobalt/nickel transport system ATP-binding protein